MLHPGRPIMPWSRCTRLLGLVLVVVVRAASAQDANHWTDQFGNRARLLGGAVVGSAGDLSAIYYNPGALANADRPEIAVSADAVEYTTTTLHGGLAPDQSVSSTRFTWLPSFFGGYIRFDRLGASRLAYCFLARTDLETRLEEHATIAGSPILPGIDSSALSLGLHQRITEYWFGLTWSRSRRRKAAAAGSCSSIRSPRVSSPWLRRLTL